MRVLAAGLVLACAGAAGADVPPTETGSPGAAQVTLYTWDFLTAEELAALRLVLVNEDALAVFLPEGAGVGFAAMAMSPEDGFIRDGALVPSAVALAGFESQAEASEAAYAACNAARMGKAECTIVLEIAPK